MERAAVGEGDGNEDAEILEIDLEMAEMDLLQIDVDADEPRIDFQVMGVIHGIDPTPLREAAGKRLTPLSIRFQVEEANPNVD